MTTHENVNNLYNTHCFSRLFNTQVIKVKCRVYESMCVLRFFAFLLFWIVLHVLALIHLE